MKIIYVFCLLFESTCLFIIEKQTFMISFSILVLLVLFFVCSSNKNCLLNTTNKAQKAPASSVTLPGQRYHVDKQCQIIFGDRSFYCAVGYASQPKSFKKEPFVFTKSLRFQLFSLQ